MIFEIDPVWESGVLDEFDPRLELPVDALRPGRRTCGWPLTEMVASLEAVLLITNMPIDRAGAMVALLVSSPVSTGRTARSAAPPESHTSSRRSRTSAWTIVTTGVIRIWISSAIATMPCSSWQVSGF